MVDSPTARCPVCGGSEWRTVLDGLGFRIDECAHGCIGRTVPPPKFEELPVIAPGMLTNPDSPDDPRSGHFTLANNILDAVGQFRSSGRLLDVGCGSGTLLKLAQDRGYEVSGIEVSQAATEFARDAFGIQPIVGFFPEYRFAQCSFDVIVLSHVLEHLDDPASAIREAARILAPDGILAVIAPNFDSLVRRIKSADWPGLQPSQHIWQLSPRSIRGLVSMAGLCPLSAYTSSLVYQRGDRSWLKWLRMQAVLKTAKLLRMGDSVTIIASKQTDLG